MREEICERRLSVVGGGVGRKGRVGDVRESEGSLVPLWGNDEGRLEFGTTFGLPCPSGSPSRFHI